MSFVGLPFAALVVVTWLGWRVAPGVGSRGMVLLAASLIFYGWDAPIRLIPLGIDVVAAWALALGMTSAPHLRRPLLAAAVAIHLGQLALFKVADAGADGGFARSGADLLLPLGLSFYTFQSLGYVADVYRRTATPLRRLRDVALFLAFFPQLVAGPIERAPDLAPQLTQPTRPPIDLPAALSGIAWGLIEKLVLADSLGQYVDQVYSVPSPAGSLAWAAGAAFGLQMYADFDGYCRIALGTAALFGVRLTDNFAEPFLATTTPEFWRRWHVTFSRWIRDNLLSGMLGPAPGPARAAATVVVVFLLVGLWHGIGWPFLAFGGWHAAWTLAFLGLGIGEIRGALRLPAAALHTLVVLVPGALLIRAPSVGWALAAARAGPLAGSPFARDLALSVWGLTLTASAFLLAEWAWRRWLRAPVVRSGLLLPLQTSSWAAVALAALVFQRPSPRDFLYFQF